MSPVAVGTLDSDGGLLPSLVGELLNSGVGLKEAFIDGIVEPINDGLAEGEIDTVSLGACVYTDPVGKKDDDGRLLLAIIDGVLVNCSVGA